MKAVMSAQAGIALLLDETGNRVIVTGETPENTTLDAALHTLRYTQDAAEVDCESVDGLRELLQQRHACDVGLRMFLILIDRHEDHGTRLLAGKCCEQRLQSADVREFVIHRLYTKPLPEDADTLSALVWSMESNWAELQTMLLPGESQPASTPSADAPQPALMMIPGPGGRQI